MNTIDKYLVHGKWSLKKSEQVREEYKKRYTQNLERQQSGVVKTISDLATKNLIKTIFRI